MIIHARAGSAKAVITPLKGVLIIYKNTQVKYHGTNTGYASKQLDARRTQFSTILRYCLRVGDMDFTNILTFKTCIRIHSLGRGEGNVKYMDFLQLHIRATSNALKRVEETQDSNGTEN